MKILWGVIDIFIILVFLMVSRVYSLPKHVKSHTWDMCNLSHISISQNNIKVTVYGYSASSVREKALRIVFCKCLGAMKTAQGIQRSQGVVIIIENDNLKHLNSLVKL